MSSMEPDDAIEGIIHPPDSLYPYYAAMADAIVDMAEASDIPTRIILGIYKRGDDDE